MKVIAELINATRKQVRQAVLDRDESFIAQLALEQKESGGDYIDINVGTGVGSQEDEIECMKWAVGLVTGKTGGNTPLSIDSANNRVIRAGLEEAPDGVCHMINSVTAEKERLVSTLELVKEYNTDVIGLAMSDDGIQVEIDKRIEAVTAIYEKAQEMDIPDDSLYFDPLVMPLGTNPENPTLTLETGRKIKERYPDVHLCMGLSNVSHGLPNRKLLNRVFLPLAMQKGFDSAIIDPTDREMMSTLKAADALLGHDEFCMNYIQYVKKEQD